MDSDGFLKHRMNVGDALDKLFSEFAYAHTAYGFGDASAELVQYATAHMPAGSVRWYRFHDGLSGRVSDSR